MLGSGLGEADLYSGAYAEKQTRAQLKQAVERAIGPETVVICDSLNYIKGAGVSGLGYG